MGRTKVSYIEGEKTLLEYLGSFERRRRRKKCVRRKKEGKITTQL